MEVMEGDPRNVMCDAVDKHHASLLVVGSHGYGIVKRYMFELCKSKILFIYLFFLQALLICDTKFESLAGQFLEV